MGQFSRFFSRTFQISGTFNSYRMNCLILDQNTLENRYVKVEQAEKGNCLFKDYITNNNYNRKLCCS